MRIGFFRVCIIRPHKVVITPPITLGWGYVFDRQNELLKISLCVFGIPISKIKEPLKSITRLWLRDEEWTNDEPAGVSTIGYTVAMKVAGVGAHGLFRYQDLRDGEFDIASFAGDDALIRAGWMLAEILHVTELEL